MPGRAWLFIAVAVGMAFGLIAGLGVALAAPRVSAWATGINAGLLAATFVAILWYSWETRKLLDSQSHSAEIARHPWLSATALKIVQVNASDGEFPRFELRLSIDNHGQTPAYIREIAVSGQLFVDSTGCRFAPRERPVRNQVIAPADFLDLHLGTLSLLIPPFRYTVESRAEIAYATGDGGRGVLTVGFRYADGEWINLDTTYRFTLSNGIEFSA